VPHTPLLWGHVTYTSPVETILSPIEIIWTPKKLKRITPLYHIEPKHESHRESTAGQPTDFVTTSKRFMETHGEFIDNTEMGCGSDVHHHDSNVPMDPDKDESCGGVHPDSFHGDTHPI